MAITFQIIKLPLRNIPHYVALVLAHHLYYARESVSGAYGSAKRIHLKSGQHHHLFVHHCIAHYDYPSLSRPRHSHTATTPPNRSTDLRLDSIDSDRSGEPDGMC